MFAPIFRGVRALMYNSHEERAMIQHVARTADVPGVVVGVGSDVPERPAPSASGSSSASRRRLPSTSAGSTRTRAARSCSSSSSATAARCAATCTCVLVGKTILPIPQHPRIHHLGFLADEQKFDAMAAADVLIMPSYFESLSMVALEAWAIGTPVLANGRCDVLKGQVIRSSAGLYYESFAEFAEALHAHHVEPVRCGGRSGENGRTYFAPTTTGPSSSGSTSTCSTASARERDGQPAPAWSRCPGSSRGAAARCRPPPMSLAGVPAGAVIP